MPSKITVPALRMEALFVLSNGFSFRWIVLAGLALALPRRKRLRRWTAVKGWRF
jgi:hypothetical protein